MISFCSYNNALLVFVLQSYPPSIRSLRMRAKLKSLRQWFSNSRVDSTHSGYPPPPASRPASLVDNSPSALLSSSDVIVKRCRPAIQRVVFNARQSHDLLANCLVLLKRSAREGNHSVNDSWAWKGGQHKFDREQRENAKKGRLTAWARRP